MKKNSIIIYQLVFYITLCLPAQAQETLDDYIQIGLKQNRNFINQQLSVDLQSEKFQEAKGKYLPNLFFDASYISARGGRTIDVPAGDLVNPAYQGLNSILGTNQYPTDIENVSEQLLPDNFHETKVRLVQPILNAKIWLNAKAQSLGIQIEEAKKEALRNRLKAEIKTAYFNYLAAIAQVEIYMQNKKLIEQLLEFNKSLVKHDKATIDIVYDVMAQHADIESQLFKAKTNTKNARAFFNYLIGRDLRDSIIIDPTAITFSSNGATLQSLTGDFASNRPEIKQLEKRLQLSNTNAKLAKSHLIPEVNLIGDLGYQGFGYTFDSGQDFYFLRVGLTWPIFQGFQNRSKIQQAQIATQQVSNQLDNIQESIDLEIQRAFYQYKQTMVAYEAAKTQLTNREKSFDITDAKYRRGSALPITLETARVNLLTAQLRVATSKYNVLIAQARLEESLNHEIND